MGCGWKVHVERESKMSEVGNGCGESEKTTAEG